VGQQTGTVEWVDPESPEAQGDARDMVAVGSSDIGGRGFNADVWVHEQYAYVGTWGFSDYASGSKERFCPSPDNAGVAVLDTRDPSKPRVVSKLQNPPGTSVEEVVVSTAPYGPRAGRDIAVAGIQVCGGPRTDYTDGIRVLDTKDPRNVRESPTSCRALGQQPDPAVPARDADQRHAGLGRSLRRGANARLRERHELGSLDPQADEVTPEPGPALPPARASGTFVQIGAPYLPDWRCSPSATS